MVDHAGGFEVSIHATRFCHFLFASNFTLIEIIVLLITMTVCSKSFVTPSTTDAALHKEYQTMTSLFSPPLQQIPWSTEECSEMALLSNLAFLQREPYRLPPGASNIFLSPESVFSSTFGSPTAANVAVLPNVLAFADVFEKTVVENTRKTKKKALGKSKNSSKPDASKKPRPKMPKVAKSKRVTSSSQTDIVTGMLCNVNAAETVSCLTTDQPTEFRLKRKYKKRVCVSEARCYL